MRPARACPGVASARRRPVHNLMWLHCLCGAKLSLHKRAFHHAWNLAAHPVELRESPVPALLAGAVRLSPASGDLAPIQSHLTTRLSREVGQDWQLCCLRGGMNSAFRHRNWGASNSVLDFDLASIGRGVPPFETLDMNSCHGGRRRLAGTRSSHGKIPSG
jgi:hypothetical protein